MSTDWFELVAKGFVKISKELEQQNSEEVPKIS